MSRAHRAGHARARYIGEVHEAKARIDSDVLYHNDKRDDTCVPTIWPAVASTSAPAAAPVPAPAPAPALAPAPAVVIATTTITVSVVETFRGNVAAAKRNDL